MAYQFDGKAIFSTHKGNYARRNKIPSVRTILRSNPIEDQRTMVARLQKEFPDVCKAITAPVTDTDIYEYFDYCDAAVQGFEFLCAVLEYMAGLNASDNAKEATRVQDYVGRWRSTNIEAFTYIRPYHTVTDLFTEADIEEHGVEFLTDAMMQIKHQRMQEDDDEARESALHLQMQYAHIMRNQSNMTQLPAPTRPPFPVNIPAMQDMRVVSNPEHIQPKPEGGPLRQLPGPPGQFSAPQGYSPLQRLTPSTEVLEHVHPGSTSRGDFHSDPTAHNATDTRNFGPLHNYVAIPSRGLPGPFSYRQLPPSTRPVPLVDRVGTFKGNLPKGKRNPKKKSSDDARIVSYTEHGPRQASNDANSKPQFAPQNIQISVARQPDAMSLIQELRPPPVPVPYPSNYQQPNLASGRQSGNAWEPFHHLLYHGQAPMQAAMEGRPRVVSNPYPSPANALQRPAPDPRPMVLTLPPPTNVQQQGTTAKEQILEENAGSVSAQVQRHISQPLDPHTFGHPLADRRTDAQDRQNLVPEHQRPALAPMSNADEPQFPETPGRSPLNEVPRRPVQEGCTIWIGGIPNQFDRAAVMVLLGPCQGLLGISGPRVSSPTKNHINRSYAFADFENPSDAAEALERLPQTRFASLPEGTFLSTNYPKPKLYPSPGRYQHGSDRDSKRPASIVSPAKSRKGEDSNRAAKSKNEHGRKPSKGSARAIKQSTSSADGNTGRSFEHISAADAVLTESYPQPEEATVIRDHYGKAGLLGHVVQSTTEPDQDSKTPSQDTGVIQPAVGTETHAGQVSRVTSDGAQDILLGPSVKPQVQESHQATISKRTESRIKAPKKKSKGSNKLSIPEKKGWEPPVQPASRNTKPNSWVEPSMNDAGTLLEDSGELKVKGKQAGLEIEAGAMTAPPVSWELTATLPKGLEIADQSFLGCNPTDDGGEQPEASVANVTELSSAKANKAQVSESAPAPGDPTLSAMRLEHPREPRSQAMRRDVSNSTQGSADTASSVVSSTAPPSSSQTECSDNSTQETLSPIFQAARPSSKAASLPDFIAPSQLRDTLEASIVSLNTSQSESVVISKRDSKDGQSQEARPDAEMSTRAAEIRVTTIDQDLGVPISLALSEMGKGTSRAQEELQNPTDRQAGGFEPGLVDGDSEQFASILTQPSPSKSDRAFSRSPARRRAPSVSPRSSSLAAPSTPIKTHRKKKPRNLTPVKETSPSRVTRLSVESTKIDSSLQTTGSTKVTFPSLTIDPEALIPTTDKSKDLPKPETPFLMDDGESVAPPTITRRIVEAANADRYYLQKKDYQLFHLGDAMQINATFNSLEPSDSASTHSSDNASAHEPNDLETTLREAGFGSLSSTSPFTVKTPELALLETIVGGKLPLENCTEKNGPMLSWVDDQGKLGPGMSWDAWTKQHEMIEVVKKATALKRLLADSSPLLWTKIESLQRQLSRFVTRFSSDLLAQQTKKTKAQKILKAKAVLNTIPERHSSASEMQKWSRNASLFLEENASEPSPAPARSRKPTTNSPGKPSRGTPSRRQQQEHRHPLLINQPDPQRLGRKLGGGEDAFRTADTELNIFLTSGPTTESEASPSTFGSGTPPEERPTPSTALISSAALTQVSKLKDLFVGMEKDRRHWSGDRYRESTPQEEERMTASNPELKPLGGELDMHKVTEVTDAEPEEVTKGAENEVQQQTHEAKQGERDGKVLVSEHGKQDQRIAAEPGETNDVASTESKEKTSGKPEDTTFHTQALGLSYSSSNSDHTTGNEGDSEKAQQSRLRGGHSPFKRCGYSAVAGRGTDGKRDRKKEANKDPWALPQGEKPWGGGGGGRVEKKKRGRQ